MLKISDILKKAQHPRKSADKGRADTAAVHHTGAEQKKDPPRPAETRTAHRKKAVPQKTVRAQTADSDILAAYRQSSELVQQAMSGRIDDADAVLPAFERVVTALIDTLTADEGPLLRLVFGGYFTEKGYLYQHSANVSILSLHLGIVLRYSREQLLQLGIAGLLHDIGLAQFDTLINQPRTLNDEERSRLHAHPRSGRELLRHLSQKLHISIFEVIEQEHERSDGSGYPAGMRQDTITEFARLIGLLDTYEALTHIRPYRDRYSSVEAVKEILKHKEQFDQRMIKTLIDVVGMYPVSTPVKLNTREIGHVARQNRGMPLRPVIVITHNAQGQPLAETKEVDLVETYSVYIQDCYTEPERAE